MSLSPTCTHLQHESGVWGEGAVITLVTNCVILHFVFIILHAFFITYPTIYVCFFLSMSFEKLKLIFKKQKNESPVLSHVVFKGQCSEDDLTNTSHLALPNILSFSTLLPLNMPVMCQLNYTELNKHLSQVIYFAADVSGS
ncbi:hypothetical protein COCON_G00204880 [Conger conger]|uniref:Uncharacterized protein n=1 Tax=Conger conger TaxID=82655 RepID=A0A9Q1CZL0_CONCO|nr:hypothetical protein COCON_G00204880 [Conger conger]